MKYYIPIILLMFIDKFLCDSPTYCQATFHLATCTNSMGQCVSDSLSCAKKSQCQYCWVQSEGGYCGSEVECPWYQNSNIIIAIIFLAVVVFLMLCVFSYSAAIKCEEANYDPYEEQNKNVYDFKKFDDEKDYPDALPINLYPDYEIKEQQRKTSLQMEQLKKTIKNNSNTYLITQTPIIYATPANQSFQNSKISQHSQIQYINNTNAQQSNRYQPFKSIITQQNGSIMDLDSENNKHNQSNEKITHAYGYKPQQQQNTNYTYRSEQQQPQQQRQNTQQSRNNLAGSKNSLPDQSIISYKI